MQNDMRDRLEQLIKQAEHQEVLDFFNADLDEQIDMSGDVKISCGLEFLVHYLIENGVIVMPCRVGDTVYYLDGTILVESKVHCISFGGRYGTYSQGQIHIYDNDKDNITVKFEQFGKTIFLTKEQAEQKLKEMRDENGN